MDHIGGIYESKDEVKNKKDSRIVSNDSFAGGYGRAEFRAQR